MKINGLNVDTQLIADGLYEIICAKGEEAIVAFGMLPKWAMDCLEKKLREKIIRLACVQMRFTESEITSLLELDKAGMLTSPGTEAAGFSEEMIRDTIQPIVHEVSVGIYRAASNAGRMCV